MSGVATPESATVNRWGTGSRRAATVATGGCAGTVDHSQRGVELREDHARVGLLHAYHHAVAAAARSGLNVIVDDVVIDDGVLGDWLEVLDELEPTWVAVRCSPEITAERELRRGDRPVGMTGTQTNSVHRSLRYAFEIDTGELTPSEALDELRGRLTP